MSDERLSWSVWKHLSEAQVNQLEAALEVPQCKNLLAEFLGLSKEGVAERDERTEVLVDFHLYNYAFCKEQRFDASKTSTYMSVMADVLNQDLAQDDAVSGREASFDRFRTLILRHCIERPPWSKGIFSLEDVAGITEYTVNSYFRHYRLYKHLFTSRVETELVQRNLHGTEEPRVPPPLCEAMPLDQ